MNLATSEHIHKLPVPREANSGDPISMGALPLCILTIWHHSIGGEPFQQRQLTQGPPELLLWLLLALVAIVAAPVELLHAIVAVEDIVLTRYLS